MHFFHIRQLFVILLLYRLLFGLIARYVVIQGFVKTLDLLVELLGIQIMLFLHLVEGGLFLREPEFILIRDSLSYALHFFNFTVFLHYGLLEIVYKAL